MTFTLTHSGIRVECHDIIAAPVRPVKFKKGMPLMVTDCFGKSFPCEYVRADGKKAIISINGGKMACDPSQLSIQA